MTKQLIFIAAAASVLYLNTGCGNSRNTSSVKTDVSLKEVFKEDFDIGTALNNRQIEERDSAANRVITKQFNTLTPENIMKAQLVHTGWNQYNFEMADKLVAYAQKNNMRVNGHTLIWHSQLPSFMNGMKNADSVRMYMADHIKTVAGRYDGKVYSWDVVNEALNEDGTMRKSVFFNTLGDGFVVDAFRMAQAAAPNTKLYYNDYNIEQPKKRAGAIELIKKIQAAGVRIDGVGIQGHWSSGSVPLNNIEESIKEFAALGIEVMFTELDLSVLPNPRNIVGADINQRAEATAQSDMYKNGFPDSAQAKLADSYAALFDLFLKYRKNVSRVTFWGVDDGQSWLNGFPIRGRTNYPLLFDRNYQPKPAFYKVVAAKTGK